MKNKKFKTVLAREIRNHYPFDFITSLKIAKGLIQNNEVNVIYDLGFGAEIQKIPTCGRGCCYVDGDTIFFTRNDKNEYIEFEIKDLMRIKKQVVAKYGREQL